MICRGHLPVVGVGRHPGSISKDQTLAAILSAQGRAGQPAKPDEGVETLPPSLQGNGDRRDLRCPDGTVAVINGYDPNYKQKVRETVEAINREIPKRKSIRAADVQRYLEFDCSKHLRLLCRRGFLEVVPGREEGETTKFQRLHWPAPAGFFESDGTVIGLAYYIQKWFKYALQDWIARHSREMEVKWGAYSLEDWTATRAGFVGESVSGRDNNALLGQVDRADGNYRSDNGEQLEVELGMKPLDVSTMTLGGVNSTEEILFRDLERS